MKVRFKNVPAYIVALVITCVACPAAHATGWGSVSPTLVERWESSPFVYYVESVETLDKGSGVVSSLKILKKLKVPDDTKRAEIEVFTMLGSHWPYVFSEGDKAIAFLKYDRAKDWFVGSNETFGGITVTEKESVAYEAAFQQLQQILAQKSGFARDKRIASWYVDGAANPLLRGQCVYGLERMLKDAESKKETLVSVKQYASLANTLVGENPPRQGASGLAELLKSHPSAELDAYMLKSLENGHDKKWRRMSMVAVDFLPQRIGYKLEDSLTSRFKEYWERKSGLEYPTEERKNSLNVKAEKKKLDLLWKELTTELAKECKAVMRK